MTPAEIGRLEALADDFRLSSECRAACRNAVAALRTAQAEKDAAVAAEREACAKAVETDETVLRHWSTYHSIIGPELAKAIRSRATQPAPEPAPQSGDAQPVVTDALFLQEQEARLSVNTLPTRQDADRLISIGYSALSAVSDAHAAVRVLADELNWYRENARICQGAEGETGELPSVIGSDGGDRAAAAIADSRVTSILAGSDLSTREARR